MDWKEWSKNTAHNVSQKAKRSIKENTIDAVSDQFHADVDNNKAVQAYRGAKDTLSELKDKKTNKEKLNYLLGKAGNKVGGKIKNSKIYEKTKKFIENIKTIVTFIMNNIKVIAIVSLILTVGGTISIFLVSLTQAFGPTPHFYCEFEPDDYTKDLEYYQQYCKTNQDSFVLENLNGHYIVMDCGTRESNTVEMEKACSIQNMILRICCMNDLNYYDCLWGADGQYPIMPATVIRYDNGGNNARNYIIGGTYETSDTYSFDSANRASSTLGARNFAASQGLEGYTDATWGYVRDASLNFENKVSAYTNQTTNTNWVWDLSAPEDCTWYVPTENLDFSINPNKWWRGGTVRVEWHSATSNEMWEDLVDLVDLLQGNRGYKTHPEGIVVVTADSAILLTGFDPSQGGFMCIDPARGMAGGFEGPVNSANFNSSGITQEMLETGNGILGYYEINPTFINNGKPTMSGSLGQYSFDSGYDGMLISRRMTMSGAPSSPYADAIVEYAINVMEDRDSRGRIVGYLWYKHNGHTTDGFRGAGDQSGRWHTDVPQGIILDNYDCSGLVCCCAIYASNDVIQLPHGTDSMYGNSGVAIPLEEMQPGDFILTSSDYGYTSHHVLVYLGDIDGDGEPECAEAKGYESGCVYHEGLPGGICEVFRIYPPDQTPVVEEDMLG